MPVYSTRPATPPAVASSEVHDSWPRANGHSSRTTAAARRCTGSVTACARAPVVRSSRRGAAKAERDSPFDLQERIRVVRSREISSILDGERAIQGRRVVVFLAPGSGRVAAIASKRIGGAVQRNRARRVLRAAWAEVRPLAGRRDAVLVARAAIDGASSGELVDEMTALVTGTARR